MSVFEEYSHYYDLLYKDKDYSGEVEYIDRLIEKYNPVTKSILDLGCGTGQHALLLFNKGYKVHGIDISEDMISIAKKHENGTDLCFSHGDIRSFNINTNISFDVVTSLFHVVSYQTSNEELINTFKTAHQHLNQNGVFIFDCWYGPAVLTDRPTARMKVFEDERIKVLRFAEPVMHENENTVDVNYNIFIIDKSNHKTKELREIHRMRYLFKPEILIILNQTGFLFENCYKFMTFDEPSYNSWYVCFVGRKI